MQTPEPVREHRALEKLAGHFSGPERMHPSYWNDEAKKGEAVTDARVALDGFAIVQDYEQRLDDGSRFAGHGVFRYDMTSETYEMHWFDSTGGPERIFRGGFSGRKLVLTARAGEGWQRLTYDFNLRKGYRLKLETSEDGNRWNVVLEGDNIGGDNGAGRTRTGTGTAKKKAAGKKATGKKTAGKKTAGKKTAGKKTAGKKTAGKKAGGAKKTARKASAKKVTGKKTTAKKATAKKTSGRKTSAAARKTTTSKATGKKAAAKKTTAKKASARKKAAARTTARGVAKRKATASKAGAKKTATRKADAKTSTNRGTATRKTAAKKAGAGKAAARKAASKTTPRRKANARKASTVEKERRHGQRSRAVAQVPRTRTPRGDGSAEREPVSQKHSKGAAHKGPRMPRLKSTSTRVGWHKTAAKGVRES